jgi:acetyl/propionyl-CoA carboxylase alpha subunit
MATVISSLGAKQFKWSFGNDGSVALDGNPYRIDLQKISPGRYSLLLDGRSYQATIDRNDFIYTVILHGKSYRVAIETSMKRGTNLFGRGAQSDQLRLELRSPMPGMVVRCEVKEGTRIRVGDGLLILEAMKMENEIRATRNGTVKKILVHDRQVVDKGELLLIIE